MKINEAKSFEQHWQDPAMSPILPFMVYTEYIGMIVQSLIGHLHLTHNRSHERLQES